jgi:hypothetical protein
MKQKNGPIVSGLSENHGVVLALDNLKNGSSCVRNNHRIVIPEKRQNVREKSGILNGFWNET